MDAGRRDYPLCDEHARAHELSWEASEWEVAQEVTGDRLRIARGWGYESLERLALNAHEAAKEGVLKAGAKADLAREIADAARKKSRMERIAELTPEQHAESRRLISRADALVNARTMLEDYAQGQANEKFLRRTLGVLIEEAERATEEAHRYHEEVGIRA